MIEPKKIFVLVVMSLTSLSLCSYAQSGGAATTEPKSDTVAFVDDIEEEISTLDAAWKPVLTDHSVGLKGGWGTGLMRRIPQLENVTFPGSLWNFGLSYRFDVPEQKYVGTILFELQYVQKGFAYKLFFDGTEAYTRTFDVIELPILWQPYIPLSANHDSRIFLSAGPFLSYTLSSYEKYYDIETGKVTHEGEYKLDTQNDYLWNYGIAVGFGLNIEVSKRWSIVAEGRYTIQLSDIMRGTEQIPGNPFRTPVDHMGGSIGVQYKFAIGVGQEVR